ncbi:hypothetical protein Tco_0127874 [Tanacetum coccineum]
MNHIITYVEVPSQKATKEDVEVPSQKATTEDVEVPSNTASIAQHTASSLKMDAYHGKKRLGKIRFNMHVVVDWELLPTGLGWVNVIYRKDNSHKCFSRLRENLHLVTRTDLMIIYGRVMTFYQDKKAMGGGLDVKSWELLPMGFGWINVIYRKDNSRKYFTSLREILHLVTRTDLMIIYGRVMTFYQDKKAEGVGLVLWGDLKVLIDSPEVNDGSDVWKNQHTWIIQSWKLYSYTGIHVLETVSGLVLHMFVDKKYPLSVNLIERMLDHQLEICRDTVGNELTTAVQLIAFLKKQISDSRRPKVHDWLRLPEELSCVHDTFHVSNLEKKCLADASLHVSLDEIKVDKPLHFVEEPVENGDHEVKRLKCSRIVDEISLRRGYCDNHDLSSQSIECDHLNEIGMVIVDSERDRLIFVDRGTRSVPLFVDRGTCSVPLFVDRGTRSVPLFVDRGTRSVPLFVMLSVTISTWFDVIAC